MLVNPFRGRRHAAEKIEWRKHLDRCAEAVARSLGISLFPEQRQCARALLNGNVVEMQTGEGKTVAAVPAAAYLAQAGKGVHILTANDYLAQRDAQWMGPVYAELGLRAAWIRQMSNADQRREAYAADVTYIAATEAGFDHLRDCRALAAADRVQRELYAVIVDEADSILIDEARIPLVLAGESQGLALVAQTAGATARGLRGGLHFEIAPEGTSFNLTPRGAAEVERKLGIGSLYEAETLPYLTAILHALHARHLLHRDVDYLVNESGIVPIDAYKGRGSLERRWPAGLHAALEEKEGLAIREPGRVLSTVTMQNYVLLYEHLCGMTGTAETQAEEFDRVYDLKVEAIPTHKPVIRDDRPDRLFATAAEKFAAIQEEIRRVQPTGRPILIGTSSVAASERLSAVLRDIPHQVLNAKNEDDEAAIIAEAGQRGAVTISTNMAGRGVDIRLGPGVAELGGLHIIGASRNESRRIDRQLRGRAGRQGDPGSSQFFLSLEDELFAKLLDPGESVRTSEDCDSLQRRGEGRHLEARLFLNKYESIVEGQRHRVLAKRAGSGDAAYRDAIDEAWAQFLEEVEMLKSGVAFINLGGKDPFGQYLPAVHELCESFWDLVDRLVEERGTAPVRRGATWTYLSVDMPFGTLTERMARGLARKVRSGRVWG